MAKPRSKNTKPFKQSILIICPGEIEQGYIQSLKNDRYHGLSISIEPRLGKADAFEKVFNLLQQEYFGDAQVTCFYVNDMDAIIEQDKLNRYQNLRKNALKASRGKLTMIESMPCIEFWFLLHFIYTTKYYPSYDSLLNVVRGNIPDYEKNKPWAKKIYAFLRDRTNTAIKHSKECMHNKQSCEGACSFTNMHELIEQLDELMSKNSSSS
ncbi:MAG: RloB family protein [Candidatus Cloacimonadaceae bacterium]|nr:RloB family protein [Candidatus Cloacimonadota bacterium]MDD2543851.1 RloB family protein [Candidatus Cloacimonadota bacterium]MDD4666866.1 RloB family protein [Candidatus Cloacimonadota bacterium]MDY0336693.1 RloB family protein [Candidatus Cloacimonadaceae bacterium]